MTEGVSLDAIALPTTLSTDENVSDLGSEQLSSSEKPVSAPYGDYQYASLAESLNGRPTEFRLLTVLPGKDDEAVRCYIDHHSYPETNNKDTIPYEALSWTWGEAGIPKRIFILSRRLEEPPKTLPVRLNLYQALMHLRLTSKRRVLWIDCACINQQDKKEKDLQVRCMLLIYQRASNVCIWLGEHENRSERAFELMKGMNDLAWWGRNEEHIRLENEWQALAGVMDRKWFHRRWILQELAFARSATVHCGDQSMSWNEFTIAVSLLERDTPRLTGHLQRKGRATYDHEAFYDVSRLGASRLVQLLSNLFRLNSDGEIEERRFTLGDLVSNLLSYEASEPRDFIYAILSLAQDTSLPMNVLATPKSSVIENHLPKEVSRQRKSEPSLESRQSKLEVPTAKVQQREPAARDSTPGTRHEICDASARTECSEGVATIRNSMLNIEYEQKLGVICRQFLQFTIPQTEGHNLDILLRSWFALSTVKTEEKATLPSWIPTLTRAAFERTDAKNAPGKFQTVRINSDPLVGQYVYAKVGSSPKHGSSYNACQIPRAHENEWGFNHDSHEDDSLFLTGFALDVIGEVKDASQNGNIAAEWLILGGWSNDTTSDQVLDRLWRTLVADRGPNGTSTEGYYRKAFEHAVKTSPGGGINTTHLRRSGHPILVEFLKRVEAVTTNRRMFKGKFDTENLGLAPEKAETGDYVCIIRGMSVPVVLRPVNTKSGTHYEMIGECYVHTMMDGRATLVQQEKLDRTRKTGKVDSEEIDLWTPRWFELH